MFVSLLVQKIAIFTFLGCLAYVTILKIIYSILCRKK